MSNFKTKYIICMPFYDVLLIEFIDLVCDMAHTIFTILIFIHETRGQTRT